MRLGLTGATPGSTPYRMPTRSLGLRPGVNLDKALQLTGGLEDAEIV